MYLKMIFLRIADLMQPGNQWRQHSSRFPYFAFAMVSLMGLATAGCDGNTESVQTMLERAAVLNDRERHDEALAVLENAVQADRGNADAYYLRGVAFENLQRLDRALEAYDECLKIEPNHTDAFNNRGVIHGRMGNLDLAVGDLTRAVELNPDDALAWSNLGLAHHEMGDLESAIKFYSQAAILSKNPQILYQRGNSHLAARRFEDAIDDYSGAIDNDSTYARAYLNRAIAYFRSGDLSSAAADLDRAERFDDDMSITPLVHNLRESLDQRTARSRAVDLVRDWLEQSGWEVNTDETCPVDFAASRLPQPVDPSVPEAGPRQSDSMPEDFYAVVLAKQADAGIVSDFELIQSAMSLAERGKDSAGGRLLCLFVVDATDFDNEQPDPDTGMPSWLYHANYDWRPHADDFETTQVRLMLPAEDQLVSGP